MDNTFNHVVHNLPPVTTNNSVWYASTADNLQIINNKMVGTPETGTSALWVGYFTDDTVTNLPVDLAVARKMVVTLSFTPAWYGSHTNTEPSPRDVRLRGWWRAFDIRWFRGSRGNGRNVRGYMLSLDFGPTFTVNSPLQLLVRNNIADANLMGTTGDYLSLGSGPSGGGYSNSPAFLPLHLHFAIHRCADSAKLGGCHCSV